MDEFSTHCPYCRHLTPVYEKDGLLHIAGHHYHAKENQRMETRYRQHNGPDIVEVSHQSRSITKFCDGGSLKIIGFAPEENSEASPLPALPAGARITSIKLSPDNKVTVSYRR